MPPAVDIRLTRIAKALGISPDELVDIVPEKPPADWLHVNGTPHQFERWAAQVLDPDRRLRLLKIAAIMTRDGRGGT